MRNTMYAYEENNRTAESVIAHYERSTDRHRWDVYERPSRYKELAFRECEELMYYLDGFDLRIIGHNCMQFSVGFQFTDPETGVVRFCYCTRDYTRYCDYVD